MTLEGLSSVYAKLEPAIALKITKYSLSEDYGDVFFLPTGKFCTLKFSRDTLETAYTCLFFVYFTFLDESSDPICHDHSSSRENSLPFLKCFFPSFSL